MVWIIPMFPELRFHLEECFDLAETGSEFVITRYRSYNANLRTQLLRSLAGPACSPGRNCSRTFAALEKRNWQTTSQCTSSASGSATHNRSRRSTIFRSPTITSRKRCSKPQFGLSRGRKAIWLSARKPLFCNGMRRIARRCQRDKLSSTAGPNPFRTSAMTTAASVCDGAAKSAFT